MLSWRDADPKLEELFDDGSLDYDSSPVVVLLAEQAKHVGDEEN
jgi:hypothetical protein